MPLTRIELDKEGCQNPDCTHQDDGELVLTQQCHPGMGSLVVYHRDSGTIRVLCRFCKRFACEIAVAKGPDDDEMVPNRPQYYRGH